MNNEKLESALLALRVAIQTEKDGREFLLSGGQKTVILTAKPYTRIRWAWIRNINEF